MRVSRENAVAVCQDYGFSTADGWSEAKLAKKLGELVQLYRSGEFELEDDSLANVLRKLAEAAKAEEILEIAAEGEDSREEVLDAGGGGEEDGELDDRPVVVEEEVESVSGCPLVVGDRVLVVEDEVPWKGIVDGVLRPDYVSVRDRGGESWHVSVDKCVLKKRAVDVEMEKLAEPNSDKPARERKPPRDDEEAEIRSLQERIDALKAKRRGNPRPKRERKLKRDELVLKTLKAHPEGGLIDRFAEEVDLRWQRQGRRSNLRASIGTVKRLVRAGVLFGLLELEGRRVSWIDAER